MTHLGHWPPSGGASQSPLNPYQMADLCGKLSAPESRKMHRRDFIALLGGAAAWPLAARAQQPANMRRIAFPSPAVKVADIGSDPNFSTFFEELKRLGYVEGTNLIIDRYSAEGKI